MTMALEGVVALVTGANGGIGRATVEAMTAAGATVIAADLQPEAAGEGPLRYVPLDVTDPQGWAALADMVARDYGRLDALVHNAGLSVVTKFEDIPWVNRGFHPFSRQNRPIKPKGLPQGDYDFPRESAEKRWCRLRDSNT